LKGNLAGPGHNCGHYNYLYHDIYVLHVHHAYDVLYLLPKEGLFKRIICIDVIRHNFIALLKVKKTNIFSCNSHATNIPYNNSRWLHMKFDNKFDKNGSKRIDGKQYSQNSCDILHFAVVVTSSMINVLPVQKKTYLSGVVINNVQHFFATNHPPQPSS
jgi:hypothetical protein